MQEPIAVENVFLALQRQTGGKRIFIARGTSRNIGPASDGEVESVMHSFPWVREALAAVEHKPEGV